MLVEFDFAVTQTAYVKAAMDEIAAFRPDGLTPANVQALADSATPVRAAYVTKREAITGARALRHSTINSLHEACVDFAAQGKSRFRKNGTVAARFERLPKQDQTFQETITRGTASEALWTALPQVGTPPAAFTVGQGTASLALAGLTALIAAARTADGAIPAADQDFQGAEADLHAKQAELADFVTAALEQGRSQFAEGTPQREIIDAIPNAPSGGGGGPTEPGVPALSSSIDSNVVTLTMSATGATLFNVFQRAPGEADFSQVATAVPTGWQSATLSGGSGEWAWEVAGVADGIEGPHSAPVTQGV